MSKDKYADYFDEEEEQIDENENVKENKKIEINQTHDKSPYKKKEDFMRPDPPSVHRKIVKDVKDLQEMDLEQLYSLPYTNSEFSKENNVEYYQSLDELYKQCEDEDMDYELVNMDDIDKENLSDVGIEGDAETQIAHLEEKFQADKENYETLFKLIYMYRMNKNKDKLRQMRDYTQNLFPLSVDMWKEWIDDELGETKDFDSKYSLIASHFERALKDFQYFKICTKLMKLLINLRKEAQCKKTSIEGYPELNTENIRKRFENYLEIWGLDFNLSSKLWDLYYSFEIQNLKSYILQVNDENNSAKLEQSKNIIRSIFRRRLTFAHIDSDIVWSEYKKWEEDSQHLEKIHTKYLESSKKAEEMINIEEKFSEVMKQTQTEDDSSALCEFLQNEIVPNFKKSPNYIRLYFEKALEVNPDDDDLWTLYLDNYKKKEDRLNLLQRATKFCFFNVLFWVILLREMEKLGKSPEEIQDVITKAYSTAQAAEDENFISEIWKATLEYYVRNFDFTFEQVGQIRAAFTNAITEIQSRGNKDYIVRLLLIWAEFEVYKAKDESQLIDLMNRIVKISPTADHWKLFVTNVKYFGNVESIRKVYKRALEFCKEEKDFFSENWIMWEKIFGTIDSIEYALDYSKMRKPKKTKLKKLEEENQERIKSNKNTKINLDIQHEEQEQDTSSTVRRKKLLKLGKRNTDSKESKEETSGTSAPIDKTLNKTDKTVIIKHLSPMTTEEDVEKFIKNELPSVDITDIRIVRDRKGISKGFSFVDFSNPKDAKNCAMALNNKILDENTISCAVSKPPKLGENDLRTIFVNNISYDSTEEKIKEAFEPFGQILDVRIISDKQTNKPKGYCYVEFLEEESVNKVMEQKNTFSIEGRRVIVKASQSQAKIRENVKYVAHVTNLPFSLTEKKLKDFFISNGLENITDCLITTGDEGQSKGFGFVEFGDEENLNKALALTGKIIRGRPVTIKLSTRNITRNLKRKASQDLESEIEVKKKQKTENEKSTTKGLTNSEFAKFLK